MGDSPIEIREAPTPQEIASPPPILHEPLRPPNALKADMSRLGKVLLSLFLLYHVAAAAAASMRTSTPGVAEARNLLAAKRYADITGAYQFWSMFAANPPQENVYLTATLVDASGDVHDLRQDIRSHRSFPYLLYERRGKINRRMSRDTWWQTHYGAYLCRRWERQTGEMAREVRFTKITVPLPPPTEVVPWRGFNAEELPIKSEEKQKRINCRTTPFAQLTAEQRARYNLSPPPHPPVLPPSRLARKQAR